ncbi:MAG: hypothetical protein AABY22_23425 [Nanoarchaeota archaeon]
MKFPLILLAILLLIPSVFAISTCSPSSLLLSQIQDSLNPSQVICSNNQNITVTISKSGDFFNIDQNTILPLSSKTIIITPNQNLNVGTYLGNLLFDDSSTPIPLSLTVNSSTTIFNSKCDVDIFPLTLSNVKINQGEKKVRNIAISVPSCFVSPITIQGAVLSTDQKPIQLGEMSLGILNSGSSLLIPIEFDANGVSSGSYSDTLLLNIFNSSGNKINVPQISVSVLVTQSISPITGDINLDQLPTCSLSAIQLSLNETYKFTCNNPNPNIQISAQPDSKYISGTKVEESAGQYIYYFRPKEVGVTTFHADFLYRNSKIGSGFNQEVRISNLLGTLSGTSLKFAFYQFDARKELSALTSGDTTIRILDEKTDTVLPNAILYLNGNIINSSVKLDANKNYELRGSYLLGGYSDKTINFTLGESKITYIITPSSGLSSSTLINITTSEPKNVSIFIDGNKYENMFLGTLSGGLHNIEFIAKDYQTTKINLTVEDDLKISSGYDPNNFKKGISQIFTLNKNVSSWTVYYQKDANTPITATGYTGSGTTITFTPDKIGTYSIQADNKSLGAFVLADAGLSKFLSDYLYWIIGGGIILLTLGYFLFFRGKTSEVTPLS